MEIYTFFVVCTAPLYSIPTLNIHILIDMATITDYKHKYAQRSPTKN